MAHEFRLEDPGEGIHEAEILSVLVGKGDHVDEGDNVLEVETDKAAIEIPAPTSGTISEIKVKEGEIAKVGDVLMLIDVNGGDSEKSEKKSRADKTESDSDSDSDSEDGGDKEKSNKTKDKQVKEGDRKDREGAEEEDKNKKKTAPRAEKEESGSEGEQEPDDSDEEDKAQQKRGTEKSKGPVPAAPSTRRLARHLGVDIESVKGTGQNGRITDSDVLKASGAAKDGEGPPKPQKADEKDGQSGEKKEGAEPKEDADSWGPVEHRPLRSVRRATAKAMAKSWAEIPHVTHHDEADITGLDRMRRKLTDSNGHDSPKITITAFAIKAAASALKAHPRFNASVDMNNEKIVLKHYYNCGVATETDRGLLVPVLRDVNEKTVSDIAGELEEISDKARAGELTRRDMQGATFTVTNTGGMGGTGFSPIINAPQVAILGLAQARLLPRVRGDLDDYKIEPRLILPLCVAFDHRVLDGAQAVRFTNHIVEALSAPEQFMTTI